MLALRGFITNSGPLKSHFRSLLLTLKESATPQAVFIAIFLMSISISKL